ncbi:MAG: hypothetical protein KJO64_08550 [Bacteroidia bacterium]|nr:hypothetical protein [Bacteroidia bacterium]
MNETTIRLGFVLDSNLIFEWQLDFMCSILNYYKLQEQELPVILADNKQSERNTLVKPINLSVSLEQIKSKHPGIQFKIISDNNESHKDCLFLNLAGHSGIQGHQLISISFFNADINDPLASILKALLDNKESISYSLDFIQDSNNTKLRTGDLPFKNHSFKKSTKSLLHDVFELYCIGIQESFNSTKNLNAADFIRGNYKFNLPLNVQWKLFLNTLRKGNRAFSQHDNWNIGVLKLTKNDALNNPKSLNINWYTPERNDAFRADPFGFIENNQLHILYELYPFKKQKGQINSVRHDLTNGKYLDDSLTIKEEHHLSYPHIVHFNNEIYCIPESHKDNCIKLYKYVESKNEWNYNSTLIQNFPAIDSTILYHNNLWWLFCTNFKTGKEHKLHLFYADDLLGDWNPHLMNPVKVDVSTARPAGNLFKENNELYRPSQDCAGTYGRKVVINKIIELTKNSYKEETVSYIEANDKIYSKGLHTLSYIDNDNWLVDGKRFKFSTNELLKRFNTAAKNLLS